VLWLREGVRGVVAERGSEEDVVAERGSEEGVVADRGSDGVW
jgi:hypothetical protein